MGGNYWIGIVKLVFGYLNNCYSVSIVCNNVFMGGFVIDVILVFMVLLVLYYDC